MHNALRFAPALSLTLSLACGSDSSTGEHEEGPVGPASGASCPDGSTLTYETFGREFMEMHCLSCHSQDLEGADRNGAPSDHNFDTLTMIRAIENIEHIDQVAAAGPASVNTAMPKSDLKPSVAERKKLGEWLACGAP